MIVKWKERLFQKRLLYTLCFVLLCLIDQIKGSADGRIQFATDNCTGFVMAAIILSAYHWKDFKKLPYLIWTGLFVVGGTAACYWGIHHYLYIGKWITAVLNVGVYGYVIIRIVYKLAVEKDFPALNKPFFFLWLVMMAGMVVSRYDAAWPFWFFVMFGCLYLTSYKKEDLDALFAGMLDGLIIGFFLVQGMAFVFRPYDTIRYRGMYANENINALFYVVSYCALLGKWHFLRLKKANKGYRGAILFLGGAMFSFVLLTMGRTALLAMGIVTLIFLFIENYYYFHAGLRGLLKGGFGIFVTAIVSFPLVFGSVRYLPALFHHPIWFYDEYSESKVHSFDPIDSPKYTDLNKFLNKSFGRYLELADDLFPKESDAEVQLEEQAAEVSVQVAEEPVQSMEDFVQAVEEPVQSVGDSTQLAGEPIQSAEGFTQSAEDSIQVVENPIQAVEDPAQDSEDLLLKKIMKIESGSGASWDDPLFSWVTKCTSSDIRKGVYRYYWEHLNIAGHLEEEHGVWINPLYWVPHAHNIYLQMAFNFGILVGILFILFTIGTIAFPLAVFIRNREKAPWYQLSALLFTLAFIGFGMLEIDWGVGQNIFTLFFIVQLAVFQIGKYEAPEMKEESPFISD